MHATTPQSLTGGLKVGQAHTVELKVDLPTSLMKLLTCKFYTTAKNNTFLLKTLS